MVDQQPLVSVVIVNWNGLEDTKECLAHLHGQTTGAQFFTDIDVSGI